MSIVLRRSYIKAKSNLLSTTNCNISINSVSQAPRAYCDDKSNLGNYPKFSSSTILIENGYNVQELPVAIKKLSSLSDFENKPKEEQASTNESLNYHLIQEEFKQCLDLKDVFSLLSKCTKITPNIALGAIERICDIEKNPSPLMLNSKIVHISMAKGAILDKLLKVVMKTEDTQTILNVLNTVSSFMESYKYQFHDELLSRVIDNKLTIEQLCQFITFLISNKTNARYSETIDKLWVGFVTRESEIDEKNIVHIFAILNGIKASKRIILALLEQKLCDLWSKISVPVMQEILNAFVIEKYLSLQSFSVVGSWLSANIHVLDDEGLLDVISKLTRLNYTDNQIENAVEKYMKLKRHRIESYVLIVGILNYCMQFQIHNKEILNSCSEFFINNWRLVPPSFLKSFIHPYGYLHFDPKNSHQFWIVTESILHEKFDKIHSNDLSTMILTFLCLEKDPVSLVTKILSAEYLSKVNSPETLKKLNLIDVAMSLEYKNYLGPLLPKNQWSQPISQDFRIKIILDKIMDSLVSVSGGIEKVSVAVSIPYMPSDETYLIDVMLHPAGMGGNTYNWKSKSGRNENVALLIHLPDHYCSDNEHLIGPQMMKKKHLRILGMKVVSLKYSILSKYYTSYNKNGLRQYLVDSIESAEDCL